MPSYNSFQSYSPAYPAGSYQQQSYAQPQMFQPQTVTGICWVDGEVGAKAQQLPPGWDITKPFPMWDTNDQVIYLKSFNQMGMPNPLTKLRYTIEEQTRQAPMMSTQAALPSGGNVDYVKKEDLEKLKEELKAAINGKEASSRGKSAV